MHDLTFADLARPTPVRILKLTLLPYSIGHEALLFQSRNPLVCLDHVSFNKLSLSEQIFSIKRAVLTCSRNWRENHQPERWLRLWGWLTRKADYPLAIAEFRNYLAENTALLPVPDPEAESIANGETDGKGRELGAPFLPQLYLFARQIGFCEPWDAPRALISALYYTHLESEGRLRIENRKEREIRLEMAEHRAALAVEEAAQNK